MAKAKKKKTDPAFDDRELATRLNISPKTVYRMRKANKIPYYRVGPFPRYTEELYQTILERLSRNAA